MSLMWVNFPGPSPSGQARGRIGGEDLRHLLPQMMNARGCAAGGGWGSAGFSNDSFRLAADFSPETFQPGDLVVIQAVDIGEVRSQPSS